jgi:hypothetical protein
MMTVACMDKSIIGWIYPPGRPPSRDHRKTYPIGRRAFGKLQEDDVVAGKIGNGWLRINKKAAR